MNVNKYANERFVYLNRIEVEKEKIKVKKEEEANK
jgi:hypothetical protein